MSVELPKDVLIQEITSWRRDLHRHPELGFDEHRTSKFVAQKLAGFGIEVYTGLAATGIVGQLKAGDSPRAIGLRADMDALPIHEENEFDYRSVHQQVMHACGHDGHTAMLLGAAKELAKTKNFNGTVYLIFQPAEEGLGGARSMVEQGLFEQFPMEGVYAVHNWPGMPVGHFGTRTGALLASSTTFDISIRGVGAHVATPQAGIDPVVVASQFINATQTITSRNIDPLNAAAISVTQLEAGEAYNVIPVSVVLKGSIRTLNPDTEKQVKVRMEELLNGVCAAYNANGEITFNAITPSLINSAEETESAILVASALAGKDKVDSNFPPGMGAEDFAYMLRETPGCYLFMGNGGDTQQGNPCVLHNPRYDFNDSAIKWGVAYWCQLVETLLPKR